MAGAAVSGAGAGAAAGLAAGAAVSAELLLQPGFAKISSSAMAWTPATMPKILSIFMVESWMEGWV